MLLKKRKKSKTRRKTKIDNPVLMVEVDIWAIEKCVRGRVPWEDTCLKCGQCGRFSK